MQKKRSIASNGADDAVVMLERGHVPQVTLESKGDGGSSVGMTVDGYIAKYSLREFVYDFPVANASEVMAIAVGYPADAYISFVVGIVGVLDSDGLTCDLAYAKHAWPHSFRVEFSAEYTGAEVTVKVGGGGATLNFMMQACVENPRLSSWMALAAVAKIGHSHELLFRRSAGIKRVIAKFVVFRRDIDRYVEKVFLDVARLRLRVDVAEGLLKADRSAMNLCVEHDCCNLFAMLFRKDIAGCHGGGVIARRETENLLRLAVQKGAVKIVEFLLTLRWEQSFLGDMMDQAIFMRKLDIVKALARKWGHGGNI